MKIVVGIASLLTAVACTTGEKNKGGAELESKDKGEEKAGDAEAKEPNASANLVTLTNSLSNNPLTSHTVAASKAEDLVARFQDAKGRVQLESKVAAERLARKNLSQVLASAKKIAELEMEKSAGNTAPESTQLELALAALNAKNYAFSEYYLQILTDSKKPKIKAAAFNAIGVIALKDDRIPEAVLYFKQALKAVSNYKPAMLNLGFAALKGGDLETARKALADMQSDWFVQYGLISIARLEGNEGRAGDLCEKVLSKEPQHKGALFNCALFELQNKKNFARARDLTSKAASAKYGDLGWDERAMQLTNTIDAEESSIKRAQAQKKAEQAAEKSAEKNTNKADAKPDSKPAPQGGSSDKGGGRAEKSGGAPASAPSK